MNRIIKKCIFLILNLSLCLAHVQGKNLHSHNTSILNSTLSYSNIAKDGQMRHNTDPPEEWQIIDYSQFKSFQTNEKLLKIEDKLRARHLLYDAEVRWLMEKAALGSDGASQWAIEKLLLRLDAESIQDMRTNNVWGPLAPPQLLCCGDLHLYDQTDGIAWKIPLNALTRGMLLTGPQGGGKSRFLIWTGRQLNRYNIPFFSLDVIF